APARPMRSSPPTAAPPPVQPTTPVGRPTRHGAPRKPANRGLIGVAAAALTVVVGLGAWALSGSDEPKKGTGAQGNVTGHGKTSSPSEPASTTLKPVDVFSLEDSKGDTDHQIGKNLDVLLKSGGHGRSWQSAGYHGDNFGKLKNGLGVVFDMGRKVRVESVRVDTAGVSGAPMELRVGDSKSLGALRVVGQARSQSGTFPIKADKAGTGQYVCVWFTTPVPDGFKAKLSEVTILGSAG
ncbi:AMP-binding protein, partial [Actinomadura logoneensis]